MGSAEHSEEVRVALAKQRLREWATTDASPVAKSGAAMLLGVAGAAWLARRAIHRPARQRSSLARLVFVALTEQAIRHLLPLVWQTGVARTSEKKS
ncbi:MAG: hypothetical protein U0570_01065 [Phycisphaerales bacterium]